MPFPIYRCWLGSCTVLLQGCCRWVSCQLSRCTLPYLAPTGSIKGPHRLGNHQLYVSKLYVDCFGDKIKRLPWRLKQELEVYSIRGGLYLSHSGIPSPEIWHLSLTIAMCSSMQIYVSAHPHTSTSHIPHSILTHPSQLYSGLISSSSWYIFQLDCIHRPSEVRQQSGHNG